MQRNDRPTDGVEFLPGIAHMHGMGIFTTKTGSNASLALSFWTRWCHLGMNCIDHFCFISNFACFSACSLLKTLSPHCKIWIHDWMTLLWLWLCPYFHQSGSPQEGTIPAREESAETCTVPRKNEINTSKRTRLPSVTQCAMKPGRLFPEAENCQLSPHELNFVQKWKNMGRFQAWWQQLNNMVVSKNARRQLIQSTAFFWKFIKALQGCAMYWCCTLSGSSKIPPVFARLWPQHFTANR